MNWKKFKAKPIIKDVLPLIEDMAERLYGPPPATGRGRKAGIPIPLVQLVRSYSEQVSQAVEEEWFPLAQVEEILKQLDPSFSPRRYGFSSLSALIQGNASLFATRRCATKGRPFEIRLLCETVVTPAAE